MSQNSIYEVLALNTGDDLYRSTAMTANVERAHRELDSSNIPYEDLTIFNLARRQCAIDGVTSLRCDLSSQKSADTACDTLK